MSELTDAIEDAIWPLVIADMHARDDLGQHRYGTRLFRNTKGDPLQHLYEELLDAAAYIRWAIEREQVRADERAKVAEEIAEAITLNVRNPDFSKQDRGTWVGFAECMAYVSGHDKAAAIARQHASARHEDPSHGNSTDTPGEQRLDETGNPAESHAEPRTGVAASKDTPATPNTAQAV